MTATETVLRARRAAEAARAQLDRHPTFNLDRKLAEPVLAAIAEMDYQLSELNRINFDLECELYYADAAIAARRAAARRRHSGPRCVVCGCTWANPGHTLCSRCAGLVVQLAARLMRPA